MLASRLANFENELQLSLAQGEKMMKRFFIPLLAAAILMAGLPSFASDRLTVEEGADHLEWSITQKLNRSLACIRVFGVDSAARQQARPLMAAIERRIAAATRQPANERLITLYDANNDADTVLDLMCPVGHR